MYFKILAGMLFLHLQAGSTLAIPGYGSAEVPDLGSIQGPGETVARDANPGEASKKNMDLTPLENAGVVMPRDDDEDEPESLEAFLSSIGPRPDSLPEIDSDSLDDEDASSDSSEEDSEAELHG